MISLNPITSNVGINTLSTNATKTIVHIQGMAFIVFLQSVSMRTKQNNACSTKANLQAKISLSMYPDSFRAFPVSLGLRSFHSHARTHTRQ